ncbi:MAG: hypothetical protein HUJ56_09850, partial [Erysipelotrichaceae bacterium]|nr:hypothetical protein [Erysipelotrichaceae bacterium]
LWKRLLAMRLERIQPDKLIIEIFEENVPKDQLKNFMNELQLKGDTVVSLCKNNDLYNYSILSKTLALRGLSKALNSRLQGKGGGSDVMIQGTFGADKDSILAVLKEVLEG